MTQPNSARAKLRFCNNRRKHDSLLAGCLGSNAEGAPRDEAEAQEWFLYLRKRKGRQESQKLLPAKRLEPARNFAGVLDGIEC
jgi:hypothetical protein